LRVSAEEKKKWQPRKPEEKVGEKRGKICKEGIPAGGGRGRSSWKTKKLKVGRLTGLPDTPRGASNFVKWNCGGGRGERGNSSSGSNQEQARREGGATFLTRISRDVGKENRTIGENGPKGGGEASRTNAIAEIQP